MEQVIPLKFASVGLSIHILAFYYQGNGPPYTIYHIQNCVQIHIQGQPANFKIIEWQRQHNKLDEMRSQTTPYTH